MAVKTPQQIIQYRYNHSKKGKERNNRYNKTLKAKLKSRRYTQSEHGKKKQKEYKEVHREHLLQKESERLNKYSISLGKDYKRALRNWSILVKERDGYTCKICKSANRLHAHHIQARKDKPELTFDVNNGITLCKDCHWNLHYGGDKS